MRAMCARKYGGPQVLQIEERPMPEPKAKELRIKVIASSVSIGDCKVRGLVGMSPTFRLMARLLFGVFRPRHQVQGSIFAGLVDALGPDVDDYQVGDRVFGMHLFGTHADYCCVHIDKAIARIPKGCSFTDAAALAFGGSTAFYFLKQAQITTGTRVLISGAGGGVGTAALQIARAWGAEVDALAHPRHRELLTKLGAINILDYQSDDLQRAATSYDVIFECSGRYRYAQLRHAMKTGARLLCIDFGIPMLLRALAAKLSGRHRIICGVSEEKPWVMEQLAELMAAGAIQPVSNRSYAFNNIPMAHAHVQGIDSDKGKTRTGSVIINMTE